MFMQVFLVDYSLAKSFIDPETNEHIKPSEVTGHLGSPAFRSTGGDNEQGEFVMLSILDQVSLLIVASNQNNRVGATWSR